MVVPQADPPLSRPVKELNYFGWGSNGVPPTHHHSERFFLLKEAAGLPGEGEGEREAVVMVVV